MHLKIDLQKGGNDELANFTHFLQCHTNGVSQCYRGNAKNYLKTRFEELNIKEKPDFNEIFPINWDIPFPPPTNPDFTFIDLFAGIGGFRLAFQRQNGKCVFTSEWDSNAKKTYEANFGEVPFGDITKINEKQIPKHDILLGGFPCQPFSLAGVSKKNSLGRKHGFADETQGTLFYDIARILKEKRPKAFLLENVKNLKSHDKGRTFKVITETLEKLEYKVYSKVINAKYYVPQSRERIYIVGFSKEFLKDKSPDFEFPVQPSDEKQIGNILEYTVDPKYTLTDNLWRYLQEYADKHKKQGNGFGFGLVDLEKPTRTLSARYYKDGSEILIPQGNNLNPRRLTPEECRALMGYPDEFIIRGNGVSDMQLYKQFGNSVAVPVIEALAEKITDYLNQNSRTRAIRIELDRSLKLEPELMQ